MYFINYILYTTAIESIKEKEILAKSNFEIERLKFMCYCETKL
ncbi:hypothetical protein CcarbDRAFT_1739 [Clostridium carboxidivorans P7]|uniref:Uncharacterized protein n=1 Tax=Clostridium carboxidivorans P7 TaxID=536227 RepID=C6PSH2_9CLOT|nr:hypothetical protein CcarbDRAFT_1739 [Clostridium carboxidivorans P7]EFG90221.1 hypothetical protein CLCAR_0427 [Clostridium carboxidivorans P7]